MDVDEFVKKDLGWFFGLEEENKAILILLKDKLKLLKSETKTWHGDLKKRKWSGTKKNLSSKLVELDKKIDDGKYDQLMNNMKSLVVYEK